MDAGPPPRPIRLDRPPAAGAEAALPADFGRRFFVFVDTEEEFDWRAPFSREATGTRAIARLPGLHARMRAAGVVPTYLVDYPVADAPAAAAVLAGFAEAGEGVIGAQLHPWVTPPFDEPLTRANSFAGNLPRALEAAKLAALTGRLERAFGRRPAVYRAGRYGVGPNSGAMLKACGYRIDCSVRAGFDYRGEGGPDFTGHGTRPYWAGEGAGALLEVPLGAGYLGALRRFGDRLYRPAGAVPRLRGALARAGLLERVAFSPEDYPLPLARAAVGAALADGARVISISFHSTSAEPGHNPYVRDAADLRRFHAWLDGMFAFLAGEGVAPASIDALLAAAERGRAQASGLNACARPRRR